MNEWMKKINETINWKNEWKDYPSKAGMARKLEITSKPFNLFKASFHAIFSLKTKQFKLKSNQIYIKS